MENSQENNVRDQPPICYFCRPHNQEIKIILKAACYRLSTLNKKGKSKQKRQFLYQETSLLSSLQRMIKMLFEKQRFELKLSQQCRHLALLDLFCQKLRLSSQEIFALIESFCDSMAQRNYELEVVATQIKNVEESMTLLDSSSEVPADKKETTIENIKDNEEVKGVCEVKVEEQQKAPFQDGTPQTGPVLDLAQGEPSFHYGMLLYHSLFFS